MLVDAELNRVAAGAAPDLSALDLVGVEERRSLP